MRSSPTPALFAGAAFKAREAARPRQRLAIRQRHADRVTAFTFTAALAAPLAVPAAPGDRAATATEADAAAGLITAPATLAALERDGLDIGRAAFATVAADLAALYRQSAAYRDLVATVTADVRDTQRAHPRARVGMATALRLFDVRWLRSPDVRLRLVGVALRLDRQPFARRADACGELRLIYRLAYQTTRHGQPDGSRLPMTVNATRWLVGDCRAIARAFHADPGAVARSFPRLPARSIELNVQTLRVPSTARPDLGGDALYALRVLEAEGDRLRPAPLENQPDVAAIAASPSKRAAFAAFLADPRTAAAADAGLALLPTPLQATVATSAAPHGLRRSVNRPFAALATPADIRALGGGDQRRGEERLRALDQQSCSGCHHARSFAGFHLLGAPAERAVGLLALAVSPHLRADLPRRRATLEALRHPSAQPANERRPAEAPADASGLAQHGERCGLRLSLGWRCAPGLRCQLIDDPDVGACAPEHPGVGDACQPGVVADERVTPRSLRCSGPGASCKGARVGFPSGMCAAPCGGGGGADVACGGIPAIIAFNRCLAAGGRFASCAGDALKPALLRRCDAAHPCRDDYACALGPGGQSVCMPPYFLQELRVDGHARTR